MLSLDDLETPDIYFLIFDDVAVYDHEEEALWLITHTEAEEADLAEEKLSGLEDMWCSLQTADEPFHR